MPRSAIALRSSHPLVVGSFASSESLRLSSVDEIRRACDLIEIRLDLLAAESGSLPSPETWSHLTDVPILFTARRASEGGAGELTAEQRMELLECILDEASLIDIEVASIPEMQPLVAKLNERNIPWIGSFHNFREVPENELLAAKRMLARNAGASAFKAAVELGWDMTSLPALSLFLQQAGNHPISLMGMGPLAPVSRLLFAQLGSVLNYGYLGDTPTAPGQWSARQLKEAIAAVEKA